MRIAGIITESFVDGPGVRFVVFTQGCPHRCPGCHNPETWDPVGGHEKTVREIMREIHKAGAKRVTLSGGEPFMQAKEAADLAAKCREKELHVVTFSGYTYEEIIELGKKDKDAARLLVNTDILIELLT